jgi:hypothetical protein
VLNVVPGKSVGSAVAPLCGKERSGRGKSSEKFTEILAYPDLLLGLADLHVLVDAEGRVADWGVRWGRSVPRGDDEFGPAAALDFVAVAVAFGSSKIHEPGRRKFVQVDAVAIGGRVGAFGLRDLRDVHANAGEADGLSRSGAGIGRGHPFDVIEIDASHNGGRDQDQSESSHEEILTRRAATRNRQGVQSASGNNRGRFWWHPNGLLHWRQNRTLSGG